MKKLALTTLVLFACSVLDASRFEKFLPVASTTTTPRYVSVSWVASASAQPITYSVFRKNPAGMWVQRASSIKTTAWVDFSVKTGITYCYAVEAIQSQVASPLSDQACATLR